MVSSHKYGTNSEIKVFTLYKRAMIGFSVCGIVQMRLEMSYKWNPTFTSLYWIL